MARSIEELVAREVRRWEAQRRTSTRRRLPCVAISRLPFAGGATVGSRLAERLGYGFLGREIVDEIARERGLQEQLVGGLDERVRSLVERFVTDAFRKRRFSESEYLRDVTRIVGAIAEEGAAVIVGRGAPFMLGPERALRVLLVAPEPVRRERLARAEGLSPEDARRRLAEADRLRGEFAVRQFGVRQEDPLLYELVLNTARLEVDAAVAVLCETLRRSFPESFPEPEAGA